MRRKIRAVILKNELENDHIQWIKACEAFSDHIAYREVDLISNNWLNEIRKEDSDILLAKPGGLTSHFKNLYDERIYILERCLGHNVFPSAEEIFIYENKRFLSFWLEANGITHPRTDVFYRKDEAQAFLKGSSFPIVAKTNIGASGSGVVILQNADLALEYIRKTFDGAGASQRTGPNFKTLKFFERSIYFFFRPKEICSKLRTYKTRRDNLQRNFVIFQEFVPHVFEWRVVRIGDSFFAHKKIKSGEKASGSLIKDYSNPPYSILDFVKLITDNKCFYSQAVDIFELSDGSYSVNEMQCIFGQSDPFQMLVDGKPGRYLKEGNRWKFEEGYFNNNSCFDLRIDWILKSIK